MVGLGLGLGIESVKKGFINSPKYVIQWRLKETQLPTFSGGSMYNFATRIGTL